ncbi:hypothetical protein [Microbacterium gorillae]|uniref:hypothetical protein n=1 Tax=Microbacterium gorillae TaxID=1231063 RepID=UPI003D9661C7
MYDTDNDVPRVLEARIENLPHSTLLTASSPGHLAELLRSCTSDQIVIVMTHGDSSRQFTTGPEDTSPGLAYDDVPVMTCRTLYSFICYQDGDGETAWRERDYELVATRGIAYPDDIVALIRAIAQAENPADGAAVLRSAAIRTRGWKAYPPKV